MGGKIYIPTDGHDTLVMSCRIAAEQRIIRAAKKLLVQTE